MKREEEKPPVDCEVVANKVQKKFPMPKSLTQIIAKHLWGNRYRVNVYARKRDNTIFGEHTYMYDSYFVKVDNSGELSV